jgi:hypothetical protein
VQLPSHLKLLQQTKIKQKLEHQNNLHPSKIATFIELGGNNLCLLGERGREVEVAMTYQWWCSA